MERHYLVWSTFFVLIIGIAAIIHFSIWFPKYIERVKKKNPAKASLILFLFCFFAISTMVVIKKFAPTDSIAGEILNEVSTVGIIGFSFFGFIFGALYVLRVVAAKREEKRNAF